jgi:hypothetical protein
MKGLEVVLAGVYVVAVLFAAAAAFHYFLSAPWEWSAVLSSAAGCWACLTQAEANRRGKSI